MDSLSEAAEFFRPMWKSHFEHISRAVWMHKSESDMKQWTLWYDKLDVCWLLQDARREWCSGIHWNSNRENKLTSRSEVVTDDVTLTIPEHNNHYNSFNVDASKHHAS
jgi:hypothetical protein